MKYSEFKEWLSNNDWDFSDDDYWITVTNVLSVSKQNNNTITTFNYYVGKKEFLALLKKAIELAETPLEERIDGKEYYLRHVFLGVKSDNNYLNMDTVDGGLFLMDGQPDHWNEYKTRFTEREIEKIEDTGFDLRNFELVEVEEEQKYYAKIKGWELFVEFIGAQYWGEVSNYGRLGFVSIDDAKDRTKDEWERLGINEDNADFVKVEEVEND